MDKNTAKNRNYLWQTLEQHIGHNVVISTYGKDSDIFDICLECEDCNEVLLDADIYDICTNEDI